MPLLNIIKQAAMIPHGNNRDEIYNIILHQRRTFIFDTKEDAVIFFILEVFRIFLHILLKGIILFITTHKYIFFKNTQICTNQNHLGVVMVIVLTLWVRSVVGKHQRLFGIVCVASSLSMQHLCVSIYVYWLILCLVNVS